MNKVIPPGVLLAFVFSLAFGFLFVSHSATKAEQIPQVPVPGKVTLVDLGAKECIPCKMMAPIMEELEKEYEGRAAVIFIDVWKNPKSGPQFGLRVIPTQIFYDDKGKEVTRHEGFLDKQSIVKMFKDLGVK